MAHDVNSLMCVSIQAISESAVANVECWNVSISCTGAEVGLEISSYSVSEEDEAIRVCASINQEFSGTVTATITTSDQSALGQFHQLKLSGLCCEKTPSTSPPSWLRLCFPVHHSHIFWRGLAPVCWDRSDRRWYWRGLRVFPCQSAEQWSPRLQICGNCFNSAGCSRYICYYYDAECVVDVCNVLQMDGWLWLWKSLLLLWMRAGQSCPCASISLAPTLTDK